MSFGFLCNKTRYLVVVSVHCVCPSPWWWPPVLIYSPVSSSPRVGCVGPVLTDRAPSALVGEQFQQLMTQEEKNKLYDAIGYQENTADPTLPTDVSLCVTDGAFIPASSLSCLSCLSLDVCIDNYLCACTTWLQITTLVYNWGRFSLSERSNKQNS